MAHLRYTAQSKQVGGLDELAHLCFSNDLSNFAVSVQLRKGNGLCSQEDWRGTPGCEALGFRLNSENHESVFGRESNLAKRGEMGTSGLSA